MRALFVALLCLPLLSQAQTNQDSVTIKKMVDEVLTNGKAYDLLHHQTRGWRYRTLRLVVQPD